MKSKTKLRGVHETSPSRQTNNLLQYVMIAATMQFLDPKGFSDMTNLVIWPFLTNGEKSGSDTSALANTHLSISITIYLFFVASGNRIWDRVRGCDKGAAWNSQSVVASQPLLHPCTHLPRSSGSLNEKVSELGYMSLLHYHKEAAFRHRFLETDRELPLWCGTSPCRLPQIDSDEGRTIILAKLDGLCHPPSSTSPYSYFFHPPTTQRATQKHIQWNDVQLATKKQNFSFDVQRQLKKSKLEVCLDGVSYFF